MSGTCDRNSGKPADVEKNSGDAYVLYSDIRFGEIGSTYNGGSPSPSPTPSPSGSSFLWKDLKKINVKNKNQRMVMPDFPRNIGFFFQL